MVWVIIVIDKEFIEEASGARLDFLGAWIVGVKVRDWPSLVFLIIYTCFYNCWNYNGN
jgi:hypothetical protein